MVDKITLSNIADLTQTTSAQTTINSNSTTIQAAFDNTLSRDGTSPNQMSSNLDMNSNQIINLPSPGTSLSPVRLIDVTPGGPPSPSIITGNNVYSGNNSFTGTNTFGTNPTTFTGDAYFKSGDPWLDVKAFGATGNGSTDDTAAIQAAITAAAGRPVFLPAGTYVVTSQLHYITNVLFTSGLKLFGSGQEVTIIDNRCTGGVSCIFSSGSLNQFQLGGYIKDLTIKTTTNTVSPGIELRAVYQYLVEHVRINGLANNGLVITNSSADADASNQITIRGCRFENLGGNGVYHNFAAGVAQTSFVRLEDCFFSLCATSGWYFLGAAGSMINCAFTECGGGGSGVGSLYIPNNGVSNDLFTAIGCSFENTFVTSVTINSLQGANFIDCEFAPNLHPSGNGVVINAGSGIRFEGSRIRVGSGLIPFTMWNLQAAATGNTISNTFWQNWNDVTQTRYVNLGFANRLSDSFDSVQVGASNGVAGVTCVNGVNSNVALPPDGTFFTAAGPTGAFTIDGFTNGYDGRRLELYNGSGQVLTIAGSGSASSPQNRITTNGSINYTLNNQGTASFRYYGSTSRWVCLGVG